LTLCAAVASVRLVCDLFHKVQVAHPTGGAVATAMSRTRWVLLVSVVMGVAGLVLAGSSLQAARPRDTLNPPAPTKPAGKALQQPIAFSHKLHAGQLGMDCAYCHTSVGQSYIANIPNVQTCMNCHQYVRTDRPEIVKLAKYHAEGRTIEWLNVHDLPDHVYFSHKRHVRAGVRCETCHGRVQEMDVVYPVQDLTMGFCVTCHKQNNERMAANNAALDCWTCHK
jgi:hypothetical protein